MTTETKKAAVGQVWKETYDYGEGTSYAKNPPTLCVTSVDATHAHGVRQPSGRKTRVRLDSRGGVSGYVLVEDAS